MAMPPTMYSVHTYGRDLLSLDALNRRINFLRLLPPFTIPRTLARPLDSIPPLKLHPRDQAKWYVSRSPGESDTRDRPSGLAKDRKIWNLLTQHNKLLEESEKKKRRRKEEKKKFSAAEKG